MLQYKSVLEVIDGSVTFDTGILPKNVKSFIFSVY